MAGLCEDADQWLLVVVLGDSSCSRLNRLDSTRKDVLVMNLDAMVRDGGTACVGEGCEEGHNHQEEERPSLCHVCTKFVESVYATPQGGCWVC